MLLPKGYLDHSLNFEIPRIFFVGKQSGRYRVTRALSNGTLHRRGGISSIATSLSQQEKEVYALANGHTIGYSIYGSPKAPTLFFLHGQGSSRLQALAKSAHIAGLQIICPDRPGIGLSTYDHQKKHLDYPLQIAQLAKHLELDTYRVIGGSGGGPYALGMQPFT